jgi:phage recombination protein Bet
VTTAELTPSKPPQLPEAVVRRGINESQWRALFNLFPSGKAESVLMVWDYCLTRKLDPFKKPCHIVPMRVKDQKGEWVWRDIVMPGIYEYRITAHRTGLYRGHTEALYGPEREYAGVTAPEWCAMTMYRAVDRTRDEGSPYPVKVWFNEVVATARDGGANERWSKAPIQMLTKCTEAAGLREAFPEEFGGEHTAEEMEGRRLGEDDAIDAVPVPPPFVRKSDPPQDPPAPPPSVAPPPPPPAPEPADQDATPPPEVDASVPAPGLLIGRIVEITEVQPGAVIAVLDSGGRAGTRNPAIIAALHDLKTHLRRVEITTKKLVNTNNPNVVRVIEQILPLDQGFA